MIRTYYQGDIPVELWELLLTGIYAIGILILAYVHQWRRRVNHPEYKFYLPGLGVKLFGGIAFAMIYIFYYGSGDTVAYYESALAVVNLLDKDFDSGMAVMLLPVEWEDFYLFTSDTGYPLEFVFNDPKTYMVVRLLAPLLILSFKSYFAATVLLSWITYGGLWSLYRMFVYYYPHLYRPLAYGILFMPSVVFWGSGILKDPITLAATCYFVVALNQVFIRKAKKRSYWITMILSGLMIIAIKPYILLILIPGALFWVFYQRLARIRNKVVLFIVMPVMVGVILAGSFSIFNLLGDSLGKFSLERALVTASESQKDLKRAYYEGNSFDIGDFEPTVPGILSKFPPAVIAGLFRPFIWEANNITMLLSGMENTFILGAFLFLLVTIGVKRFIAYIFEQPLLFFCLLFAVLFSFMIGLSTSNFGALVRFKIPLLPLLMGALIVMLGKYRQERARSLNILPKT